MDIKLHEVIMHFAGNASRQFPIKQYILFGSRARGDEHSESDVDIAVVLTGEPGDFIEVKLALSGIAFDTLLEYGLRIQAFPVWESEWNAPETYSNPGLLHNIAQEGIPL